MTTNHPNPFHILNARLRPDELTDQQKLRFESTKVESTMKRVGLGRQVRSLVNEAMRQFSHNFLTFNLFRQEFPTFPVSLTCHNLNGLSLHSEAKAALPIWFKDFQHLPFMKFYAEAFESLGSLAQHKPVGMVFPRKGFPQGLIVHNGDVHEFVPPQGSCFVHLGGGKKSQGMLVVQPYVSFLDHIYRKGHGWKFE